jgi:hypothetical protein
MQILKYLTALVVIVAIEASFPYFSGWKHVALVMLWVIFLSLFVRFSLGFLQRKQSTAKMLFFVYIEDCGCCRYVQTATIQDALQRIKNTYEPGGELFQRVEIPSATPMKISRIFNMTQILRELVPHLRKQIHRV